VKKCTRGGRGATGAGGGDEPVGGPPPGSQEKRLLWRGRKRGYPERKKKGCTSGGRQISQSPTKISSLGVKGVEMGSGKLIGISVKGETG